MSRQVDSSTQAQPDQATIADPIEQARQLVHMLSGSLEIKRRRLGDDVEDNADERTLVVAAVGIAIAHHIARIADALEQRN